MSIKIQPYTESWIEAVRQFNGRLRDGGLTMHFHDSCVPHGLPKLPGRRLYEEHFVAADENAVVRGAYGLKHQDFWIAGQTVSIADFWLPISEGAVDRAYASVAPALLYDALRKQPLLYGLGMGGHDKSLVRMLVASGWRTVTVPFFFRPVHPMAFLRNVQFLRRRRTRAALLDFLAYTGLGWLGIKASQQTVYRKASLGPAVRIERFVAFEDWADRLWEDCRAEYGLAAVRDVATLQLLYPATKSELLRIRVMRGDDCLGWAVLLDSQLAGHKHFGRMRLGSLVDCMAKPKDAQTVVVAATNFLENRGVDLIVSNQAHAAWSQGLRAAGFVRGPSNFIFATSPKLTKRMEGVCDADLHLNRGDGDGPIHL